MFEARYGDAGIVELDALEGIHPGALADIVRAAVGRYRDEELSGRLWTADRETQQEVNRAWTGKVKPIRERLAEWIGRSTKRPGRCGSG